LFVAFACQKLLIHFAPESLAIQTATTSNWPAILSALISSIVAAILFGLFPALRFSRGDLNSVLSEATRGATISKSAHRILGGLVSGQIAISTLLLVGAALAIVSFQNLGRVDPGFAKNNTLFLRVGYLEGRKMGEDVLQTIAAVPGVEAVGASHIELLNDTFANPVRIAIDDKPDLTASSAPTVNFWLASKDYFTAAGIPLLAGRGFVDADEQTRPYPILINEAFAKRYFPNEDPLGKTLHIPRDKKDEPGVPRKIVGVVASVRQRGLREEPIPILYALYTEFNTGNINFVVRSRQNPAGLAGTIRAAIKKLNPELIMTRVASGEETLAHSLAGQRFATQLMFTFATIGALLAAIGLYGMLAYAVTQRTREIGLRIALGAQRDRIMNMILRHGLVLTATGLLAGLAASIILARAMRTFLYQVSPTDPATYAAIALLLPAIALLACWLPARRATRIDAITALHAE
jgi:putative ABC transport system permease protein